MDMSVVDFEVTQRVLTVALGSEKKNSVFKDREAFGFYGLQTLVTTMVQIENVLHVFKKSIIFKNINHNWVACWNPFAKR